MLPKAERIDEIFTVACVEAGTAVLSMVETALGIGNVQIISRAQGVRRFWADKNVMQKAGERRKESRRHRFISGIPCQ